MSGAGQQTNPPKDSNKCNDCEVLRSLWNSRNGKCMTNCKMCPIDVPANPTRCSSMAQNVMLNIMSNNVKGIRHQLTTLASCHNCDLNYKVTKLITKMKGIGEEEGLKYIGSKMTFGDFLASSKR